MDLAEDFIDLVIDAGLAARRRAARRAAAAGEGERAAWLGQQVPPAFEVQVEFPIEKAERQAAEIAGKLRAGEVPRAPQRKSTGCKL